MVLSVKNSPEQQVIANSSAFKKIRCTGGFRTVAQLLLLLLCLVTLCLVFIPWQQSISGIGKVTVYAPMDRPQNIEAMIAGRIGQWHVQEGQAVEKGQLLLSLSETDPKYLDPSLPERLQLQKEALEARKTATLSRIDALKNQVGFLGQSRQAAIPSAQLKTSQASSKIAVAQQGVTAAQQNVLTAALNLKRLQVLHEKGLRSTRDLELAQQQHVETQTRLEQAKTQLSVTQQEATMASFDQSKVTADTAASVSNSQASIASAYETLATTNSDLAKLATEISSLTQRVAQRHILAPKAGIVVRLLVAGQGEAVSEGDIVATLMPKTTDQAVELRISDNDAPLVAIGRPVRLQFSGWPALQFSGWPAVAVGTFAGRITVIDAMGDGNGKYRVWVTPDRHAIAMHREQPWPSAQYLRPGSGAVGWIMLDTVPLWFELWRQFNAFPPTVNAANMDAMMSTTTSTDKTADDSKPKLEKRKKK